MKMDEKTTKICRKIFFVMLGLAVTVLAVGFVDLFLTVCRWKGSDYFKAANLTVFLLMALMFVFVALSLFFKHKVIHLFAVIFTGLTSFMALLFVVMFIRQEQEVDVLVPFFVAAGVVFAGAMIRSWAQLKEVCGDIFKPRAPAPRRRRYDDYYDDDEAWEMTRAKLSSPRGSSGSSGYPVASLPPYVPLPPYAPPAAPGAPMPPYGSPSFASSAAPAPLPYAPSAAQVPPPVGGVLLGSRPEANAAQPRPAAPPVPIMNMPNQPPHRVGNYTEVQPQPKVSPMPPRPVAPAEPREAPKTSAPQANKPGDASKYKGPGGY